MPMYKKSLLVLFCIALFASVSTFYYLYTQEDTTPIITDNMQTQTQDKQEDTTITVYVSGEVNSPGLVELPMIVALLMQLKPVAILHHLQIKPKSI